MTLNEIRVGNYAIWNNEIKRIGLDTFAYESDTYGNFESYKPIKLTNEWLVKLGFEWDIFYQGWTDGNWVLTEGDKNQFRISYGKRKHDILLWNIKYVHQLQNLYFALCGKELIIQL